MSKKHGETVSYPGVEPRSLTIRCNALPLNYLDDIKPRTSHCYRVFRIYPYQQIRVKCTRLDYCSGNSVGEHWYVILMILARFQTRCCFPLLILPFLAKFDKKN